MLLKRGGVGIGPAMPQDTAPLFIWMNDVEATSHDCAWRPTDHATFAKWLANFTSDPTRVMFMIRMAGRAHAAGYVILSSIQATYRSAELGIRIGGEADRGRGIGKAAVALALDYAWNHLNLVRVELRVLVRNERAIGAYRSAGFGIEGRHAKAAFVNGSWCDMLTMAALNPREHPVDAT